MFGLSDSEIARENVVAASAAETRNMAMQETRARPSTSGLFDVGSQQAARARSKQHVYPWMLSLVTMAVSRARISPSAEAPKAFDVRQSSDSESFVQVLENTALRGYSS